MQVVIYDMTPLLTIERRNVVAYVISDDGEVEYGRDIAGFGATEAAARASLNNNLRALRDELSALLGEEAPSP